MIMSMMIAQSLKCTEGLCLGGVAFISVSEPPPRVELYAFLAPIPFPDCSIQNLFGAFTLPLFLRQDRTAGGLG